MISISLNIDGNKSTNAAGSAFVWLCLIAALLLCSLFKSSFLPPRFFYDSAVISEMIPHVNSFSFGSSYANTAYFYRLIGVNEHSTAFILAATCGVIFALTYSLRYCGRASLKPHEIAVFVFYSFLAVVYVPQLSKEFIAFLPTAFLLFFWRFHYRAAIVGWMILVVTYGLTFRTYWLLFILQFLALQFVFRRTHNLYLTFAAAAFSLLVVIAGLKYGLGIEVESLRGSVNEKRLEDGVEDARTMILPWISGGSTAAIFINSIVTLITLLIPIPLLLLMTPYYVFIFFMVSLIFIKIFRRFNSYAHTHILNERLEFSVIAVLSFVSIQSLFEPDYGSYVRHLAPFYPLMFIGAFSKTHSR